MTFLLDIRTRDAVGEQKRSMNPATRSPVEGLVEGFAPGYDYARDVYWLQSEDRIRNREVNGLIEQFERETNTRFPLETALMAQTAPTEYKDQVINYITQFLKKNPQYNDRFDLDIEKRVTDTMRRSAEDQRLVGSSATGWGKFGNIAGQLIGGLADPQMLVTSVVGGLSLARAGASFGRVALTEGGFSAGQELAAQPMIAGQAERAGEDYTFEDAVLNVALAGIAPGALHGAAKGLPALTKEIYKRANVRDPNARRLINFLERAQIEADGPIAFGDRFTALKHLNDIDNSASALIRGELLPEIKVDVTDISYKPLSRGQRRAKLFAQGINDPNLQKMFLEETDMAARWMRSNLKAAEQRALNTADSPEIRAYTTRMANSGNSIEEMTDEIDHLNEVIGQMMNGWNLKRESLKTLSRYVPDETAANRLRQIDEELYELQFSRKRKIAQKKQALMDEAKQILAPAEPDIRANMENDIASIQGNISQATRMKQDSINALKQTPEYRHEMRREMERVKAEYNDKITSMLTNDYSSRVTPTFTYHETPVRAVNRKLAQQATATSEALEKALPEIDESLYLSAKTNLDSIPLRISDAEGNIRQTTAKELLAEIDEDRFFLQQFKECRIGKSV